MSLPALQIYRDKILADSVDDSLDNQRQTMSEYVADWFETHFGKGMKGIATEKLEEFRAAVHHFQKDSPYIRMVRANLSIHRTAEMRSIHESMDPSPPSRVCSIILVV